MWLEKDAGGGCCHAWIDVGVRVAKARPLRPKPGFVYNSDYARDIDAVFGQNALEPEPPPMPTRDEMRKKIEQDLQDRGVTPSDPRYDFVKQTMEDMNQGVADLDDELADLVERLQWLANAPTWVNVRKPEEFDPFVEKKIAECDAALAALKLRWEQHKTQPKLPPK